MLVYIMDGDYEVLKKLEALVNDNSKCKVKCFTNSQALVKAFRKDSPDAVLLDFDTQNGFSSAITIKNENPSTKIVMMSEERNKAIELFELGLDGFLQKPLDNEKVKEQLFRLQHPILAKISGKIERKDTV